MKHDLTQMTAAQLGKLYAKAKASPVDTMKAVLARSENVNPILNAFCKVDAEAALAAERVTRQRARTNRQHSALATSSNRVCR